MQHHSLRYWVDWPGLVAKHGPALLLAASAIGCMGCQPGSHAIQAYDAWARATPPGVELGAAYLEIEVDAADTLLGASTTVASGVEMHSTSAVDGMARMQQVERVPLSASSKLRFAPGGMHLMLVGLQQPLQAGSHFPLTLRFERSAALTIDVAVLAADSTGP